MKCVVNSLLILFTLATDMYTTIAFGYIDCKEVPDVLVATVPNKVRKALVSIVVLQLVKQQNICLLIPPM